jgi:transposase
VADGAGVPLTVVLTTANAHDSKAFEEVVDVIEPIKRPKGDRGSDPRSCTPTRPRTLRSARIPLRKRKHQEPHSEEGGDERETGRHRRVAERTPAWLASIEGSQVRYERRADIHEAFLPLSCSLSCLN